MRLGRDGIWKAISTGGGLAHSAQDHLLIGRNEPGGQNIIRVLRAASRERGVDDAADRLL